VPRSQSPVLLPGDPTLALHATTKQYVDNGLSGKISTSFRGASNGVGSLGSDGKQPAGEMAVHTHTDYELAANKGAANGYPALGSNARLVPAAIPLVLAPVVTTVVSSAYTPDVGSSSAGWYFNLTASADLVIGAPTNGVDHQVVKLVVVASGGARNVQFSSSGIVGSTGLTTLTFAVPQNKVLIAALQYTGLISTWVLTAATVSV
jgi:hypothetical protein